MQIMQEDNNAQNEGNTYMHQRDSLRQSNRSPECKSLKIFPNE